MSSDNNSGGCLAVVVVFLVYAALAFSGACSRPDRAKAILAQQGYTNVVITGYKFFDCGDDVFSDGFTATAPNGSRVTGAVCSGFFKSSTVRFK